MTILDKAIVFAAEAHAGACRKGSHIPYILHPLEAASIAATMTEDLEVLAAAVLHDVAEDTPCTLEEIRERFGGRVAELVSAETEQKRPDLPPEETWRIRKAETIRRLRQETSTEIKIVVMGDKLSNLRAMYRDYLRYCDKLWERFHQRDPAAHGWYYKEVGLTLKCLSEYPAWEEYWHLYREIWKAEMLAAYVIVE